MSFFLTLTTCRMWCSWYARRDIQFSPGRWSVVTMWSRLERHTSRYPIWKRYWQRDSVNSRRVQIEPLKSHHCFGSFLRVIVLLRCYFLYIFCIWLYTTAWFHVENLEALPLAPPSPPVTAICPLPLLPQGTGHLKESDRTTFRSLVEWKSTYSIYQFTSF